MALDYQLTFGYVPFVLDTARVIRSQMGTPGNGDVEQIAPGKFQPFPDLIDELNRIIPFHYLQDFSPPSSYPGRNLGAISRRDSTLSQPNPEIKIGDWYYPNTASRWSVFRGLATSTMVEAMLAATGGNSSAVFVMEQNPLAPQHSDGDASLYTLSTSLYMLPPRPLAEHGGEFDGLYLVTLVDERYYFQGTPVCLHPTKDTTWASLASELALILGISLSIPSIPAVYGTPEPDSQLWCNFENASILLDAVAYNVGCVVVRALNGTYALLTPVVSQSIVNTNRGNAEDVVRTAGGDIFYAGGNLPVGDLTLSKNSIVPSVVHVTFPKYIVGNDPVPHYLNSRYPNQRPTSWYEESYGEVHDVIVPIQSGGSLVAGLTGTSTQYLHSTAKAIYQTEASAASGFPPINSQGLTSLAMQMAQDLYNTRVAFALDEVYPGTFAWEPEGLHDIVWSYSARSRQACTRVLKTEWNDYPEEFQHSHVPVTGTNIPPGVGGRSVNQTWRDSDDNTVSVELGGTMGATDSVALLSTSDCLPTQNRWKGLIDSEIILFEGTSGGTTVGMVYRGIDGTIAAPHANGATLTQVTPNQTYGVNLVTAEKMQFVYPSDWTSGGVQGVNIVPQTQTIQVFSSGSEVLNGVDYFSGQVQSYDTTGDFGEFIGEEFIWAVERNAAGAVSGSLYGGQFAGFSKTIQGVTRPVYLFSAVNSFNNTVVNFSSGTINYNNTTINYNSGTTINNSNTIINYSSGTIINYTSGSPTTINYYGSGTTQNIRNNFITNVFRNNVWSISGPGYVNITAPTAICGPQFWCCTTYVFPSILVDDWDLPAPVTVFDLQAAPGGTEITGIKASEFGAPINTGPVTNATNAHPIVLTVPGWTFQPQVGFGVKVTGINGNTAANGTWTVQAATATTVTLTNTTGNGAFVTSPNSTVQLTGPNIIALNNIGGTGSIVLSHNDSGSDPANRIFLPPGYGTSVTLATGDSIILWWDYCADHVWKVLACTVGGISVEHGGITPTSPRPMLNFIDSSVAWSIADNAGQNRVDLTAAVASGSVTSGMLASGLLFSIGSVTSENAFGNIAFTSGVPTTYQPGGQVTFAASGATYMLWGQAVGELVSNSGGAGSCILGTKFNDGGGGTPSTITQASGMATFPAVAAGGPNQYVTVTTIGKAVTVEPLRTIVLQVLSTGTPANTTVNARTSIMAIRVA